MGASFQNLTLKKTKTKNPLAFLLLCPLSSCWNFGTGERQVSTLFTCSPSWPILSQYDTHLCLLGEGGQHSFTIGSDFPVRFLFCGSSWAVLCLVTQSPWTEVCQAPLSVGILQARILEWVAFPFSRSSWAVPVKSKEDRECNHCAVYFSFLVHSEIEPLVYGKPS